jgi:hypothetical protein
MRTYKWIQTISKTQPSIDAPAVDTAVMSDPAVRDISELHPNAKNPRRISEHDFKALQESIKNFGDLSCIVFNRTSQQLVGGHQRIEAIKAKYTRADVVITNEYDQPNTQGTIAVGTITIDGEEFKYREVIWDAGMEAAANIAANRIQGEFNLDLLAEMDYEISQLENGEELLRLTGQTSDEVKKLMASVGVGEEDDQEHGSLTDSFLVPPFSVLDTKQGYWQSRRGTWMELGIQSEVGRDGSLLYGAAEARNDEVSDKIMAAGGGTSVFDPVLCEILCSWFNLPNGTVLDQFAGGSVRGVVATKLGQQYVGIELRGEQVEANRTQAEIIFGEGPKPLWIQGDSSNTQALVGDLAADFLFSCPPYADLEVYSDDPADLSNMPYEAFLTAYRAIIAQGAAVLKDDRFAAFVVGEVRGKNGAYYNFVGDTIKAFKDAGLHFYNEMILVNSAGSLPLRAGRQFNISRKIGKQHQNVLVFYKGELKNININFPELDFSKLEDEPKED